MLNTKHYGILSHVVNRIIGNVLVPFLKQMHANKKQIEGKFYIVSTPIGNLEDITLRAIRILKEVDLIAAEDTRHTRKLLSHYDIHTPTTSYFEGNQHRKAEKFVERLKNGEKIALVSNAGTPVLSDPGYPVVKKCIEAKVPVIPIPGATACVAAAVVSGLPLHNFVFEGFLSPKSGRRRTRLKELKNEERTLIFYVSPYRLVKFLNDVLEILGDREIVVASELTKVYEEIYRGKTSEAVEKFKHEKPRGEFSVVIHGKDS